MVRTQVYLTEEEKNGLESVALAQGISQSDLIRQAIDAWLAQTAGVDRSPLLDEIAGLWAGRNDLPDLRELRSGWRRRPAR